MNLQGEGRLPGPFPVHALEHFFDAIYLGAIKGIAQVPPIS